MVRDIRFYECSSCGNQFDSYSQAEECEWSDEQIEGPE